MIVLLLFGAIAIALTAGTVRISQRGRAARRTARGAANPITPVGSITPGSTATLVGTVRIEPERALTSPLGGARCVAFRVTIHEQTGSAAHLLLELRDAATFAVEGAHGRATIGGEPRFEFSTQERNPAHGPKAAALLEAKGTSIEPERLLWAEERIEDGAEVLVTGTVAHPRARDGGRGGAFRGAQSFTLRGDVVLEGDVVARVRTLEQDAVESARLARIFGALALVFWVLAVVVAVFEWAG